MNKRLILLTVSFFVGALLYAGGSKQAEEPEPAPAAEAEVEAQTETEGEVESGTLLIANDPARYVATVNGVGLPRGDYERAIDRTRQQYAMQGQVLGEADLELLREQLLEQFVAEELLYQEGLAQGLAAEDQAVQLEFQRMRGQFATDEEWEEALVDNDTDEEELTSQIERNLVVQQMMTTAIGDVSPASDEEVQTFYDDNPSYFPSDEQVTARHILISNEGLETEEEITDARDRAEAIRQDLLAGADFATVAQEKSEGPSASRGGELGSFGRGQMVAPFEEAVFSLAVGEISEVVETQFGYHIIEVTDRQEAGLIPLDDVASSIQQFLVQQRQAELLQEYVDGLKEDATIEILNE